MPIRRSRSVDPSVVEAQKALREANESIELVKARGPEITELSRSFRRIRERNHFAERLAIIMKGEPV